MTTPKKFTASTQEQADAPAVPFTLDGVYAKGKTGPKGVTTWSEDFELAGALDASVAGFMANAFVTDGDGNEVLNPQVLLEFLYLATTPDSSRRFRALVADKERLVSMSALGEVFYWATEELSEGRPTPPS